jgi:zinc transporter, ZIP family
MPNYGMLFLYTIKHWGLESLTEQFHQLIIYLPFGVISGIAGGIAAIYWDPGSRWRSYIQHCAAGLLTAIIAVDILPEVRQNARPALALAAFAVGALMMIGFKLLSERLEDDRKDDIPVGLPLAAALDTFIDGAIIGAGFALSDELGLLLMIGLGLELSVLTLSIGSEFNKAGVGRGPILAITSGIAIVLALGAITGLFLFGGLAEEHIALVLSFAAAALLYLVSDELLAKAHEDRRSPGAVTSFFIGFLALMAFTLLGPQQDNF